MGFPGGSDGEVSAYSAGDLVQSLGQEDPLEKEMATHSSVLAWRIPGTGDPAWWAAVHGVTQSPARLKQLSSSSWHGSEEQASEAICSNFSNFT